CDGVSRLAFQRRRASIAALADRYSAEIPEPAFDLRTSRVGGRVSAPTTPRRLNGIARRRGGRIWRLSHGETRLGQDTPARENFQHRRVPATNALGPRPGQRAFVATLSRRASPPSAGRTCAPAAR